MNLPDFQLHEARTLDEAVALLDRLGPEARLLAGGTDLLVDLKVGRTSARHVISMARIRSIRGITETDAGLNIGAMTTLADLNRDIDPAGAYAPILDASREMAATPIRTMATVGGNLAGAVPCADLPPILMTLGASVAIGSGQGERRAPLDAFFIDARRTVLRPGEVLIGVLVPRPPGGFGAAYARFALRLANATAVAGVAAGVQIDARGMVRSARIALGAVAPTPRLVPDLDTELVGRALDDAALDRAAAAAMRTARPISDVRGSAQYRLNLVGVLTRRALRTAARRAGEAMP